jgi:hypothetical protein
VLASHFDAIGKPNGYMPRGIYVVLMFVIVIVLPSFLAFLPSSLARRGDARLNIPNREYWLAPQKREATVAYLGQQGKRFATAVLLFLAYVHWLVVQANTHHPPSLSASWLVGGLTAFLVFVALWVGSLYAHFRRSA